MTGAFEWLGWLAEWVASLIPRLRIVRATHAGVKFRHGSKIKEMKPGLHVYWPIVTEVVVMPVARQTHNLLSQALLTKDGKQVVVGGIVVYSIKDIVSAVGKAWDVSDTISDISMAAIAETVVSHDLDYLQANLAGEVQQALTRATRKKLSPYGVKVHKTLLSDFAACMVIKNVSDGMSAPIIPVAA